MGTQITLPNDPASVIVPPQAGKDRKHRLSRFAARLREYGHPWHQPDLVAYRDELLATLSPSSVSAHLSTVRARYKELLRGDAVRDVFYTLAGQQLTALGQADTPANRKAFVDEMVQRIENAIAPETAPITLKVNQDRPDSDHLRLSKEQASALLATPGTYTLMGLRDTALVATLLCTGIREGELVVLEVPDLRQQLGGELALHVREGKGCKERLVPWGSLAFGLAIADKWLEVAGIREGMVFRGFYKGGRRLRSSGLTERAVQKILGRYKVMVNGKSVSPRPHDLRRTYARRLYEAGVEVVAIQQNLGHADLATTLAYIGELDADRRKPPAVYDFGLRTLDTIAL